MGSIRPPSRVPAIRTTMFPKDTNPNGSIFGGFILSLVDQAAAVEAIRQSPGSFVTVAMDKVVFDKPVCVGDIVSIWAETKRIGRSSIDIHTKVLARPRDGGDDVLVTQADVRMVKIDANRKPTPIHPE